MPPHSPPHWKPHAVTIRQSRNNTTISHETRALYGFVNRALGFIYGALNWINLLTVIRRAGVWLCVVGYYMQGCVIRGSGQIWYHFKHSCFSSTAHRTACNNEQVPRACTQTWHCSFCTHVIMLQPPRTATGLAMSLL